MSELTIAVEFVGLMVLGRYQNTPKKADIGLLAPHHLEAQGSPHEPVLMIPVRNAMKLTNGDDTEIISTGAVVGPDGESWAAIPISDTMIGFRREWDDTTEPLSLSIDEGPAATSTKSGLASPASGSDGAGAASTGCRTSRGSLREVPPPTPTGFKRTSSPDRRFRTTCQAASSCAKASWERDARPARRSRREPGRSMSHIPTIAPARRIRIGWDGASH